MGIVVGLVNCGPIFDKETIKAERPGGCVPIRRRRMIMTLWTLRNYREFYTLLNATKLQ